MITDIPPARGPRPGTPAPPLELPLAGGGTFRLADPAPRLFTMLVFNRGLHCRVCRAQFSELNRRFDEFAEKGIDVVSISGESKQRARQIRDEWKIDKVPLAYGLGEAQMREWAYSSRAGSHLRSRLCSTSPLYSWSRPTDAFTTSRSCRCRSGAPISTTCSAALTTGRPTTTPPVAATKVGPGRPTR